MRAICAWPPATGTGIWNVSTGCFGSVISMIIVPLSSNLPPFSGLGRGAGKFCPLCRPTNAIVLPSG